MEWVFESKIKLLFGLSCCLLLSTKIQIFNASDYGAALESR